MEEQPIMRIPNDTALKLAYEVYKPSAETLQLLSEQKRTIYPELFIENERLGTLKDLSTAAVAVYFGPPPPPLIAENPLLFKVFYDALDIDLPLDQCCHVTEERFWKRVVLAKHPDKTLAIKRNINWKNLGVTLKFVELVEQCPVEYWPEEEMKILAFKIKDFILEMHIKHLQSLREHYYEKYFLTESEDSSSEEEEEEDSSYEEDDESLETTSGIEEEKTNEELVEKSESQLCLEANWAVQRAQLNKQRQDLKEAKQKAREAKIAKRQQRKTKRQAKENPPEKKPLKKIPDNIFDIKVSDSEDESEERIVDKRNKNVYLSRKKRYNYPAQHCHHVDLKFVQFLTNLEILTLEFWGPPQGRYFHKRHHRFSLDDMKNLSLGLVHLSKLKTFRLRNSSMDAEKLQTLCRALAVLPCLEILDFGFDQLKDDCGFIFEELLEVTQTLQSLELESNFLSEQTLHDIGLGLKRFDATTMLYLGLARNPLTDKALHGLITQIIGTNHVQHLNITAAKFLTEHGICCCLANELLRKHSTLVKLDICAIQISSLAADEIVKSLDKNETILEINFIDCGLDLETEIDIHVLLRRNKYISEHYYLGDPTVTKEEIKKWLNRTSNPILLKVLAERETEKKCLENRSQESKTHSNLNTPTTSLQSVLEFQTQLKERQHSSLDKQVPAAATEHFVYPANDFNEGEFLKHVYQPGPQERYYYFKTWKQKYSIKPNIKNISLI